MTGTRPPIPARLAGIGGHRPLAALLILAVLLCHGAVGALHATAEAADGQHAAAEPTDDRPYRHGDGAVHAGCDVAVFVVLLGAAFVLFSGRASMPAFAVPRRASGLARPPSALIPPRGPSPPLLQVFRL